MPETDTAQTAGGPARRPPSRAWKRGTHPRHARGAAGGPAGSGLDLSLGALLVTAYLVVAWRTRAAPHWGDAQDVFAYAMAWPDVADGPVHHGMRIGSLLPARLAYELLGYGQVSFALWPVLSGAVLIGSTYALGRMLAGRLTGVVAALGLLLAPVLVRGNEGWSITTWQLLPDLPCAAMLALGYACLVAAARDGMGGWGGGSRGWLAGAGLAFGWAFLVREYAVLVYPAVLLALVLLRVPVRRWVWSAVPALGCLVLDLANAAYVFGDPLARFDQATGHGSDGGAAKTRAEAWAGFVDAVTTGPRGTTLVVLGGLALLSPLLVPRRWRTALVPASGALSLWLGLTLLGGVLSEETPSLRIELARYWLPVLPLVAVGAALVLASVVRSSRGLLAPVVVAGFAFWAWPAVQTLAEPPREEMAWNALREFLSQHDSTGVLAEARAARTLELYRYEPVGGERAWDTPIDPLGGPYRSPTTFPPPDRSYNRGVLRASDHPADDLVLVAPTGPTGRGDEGGYSYEMEPGWGWTLVWERAPLRLYVATESALAQRLGVR